MSQIDICLAYDDIKNVKTLFQAYTDFLGENLSFQHYDDEIQSLPGKYDLPHGRLYLAYLDHQPVGCIALRRMDEYKCEIKRLYVLPQARGHHLGRLLMERILEDSKEMGYQQAYLDTLERLEAACHLYDALGAKRIPAYYHNPLPHVVYYRFDL